VEKIGTEGLQVKRRERRPWGGCYQIERKKNKRGSGPTSTTTLGTYWEPEHNLWDRDIRLLLSEWSERKELGLRQLNREGI